MSLLTPEDLREVEQSLAYQSAGLAIEQNCLVVEIGAEYENGWYDLATAHLELSDEVAYLDSRRLLQRHPEHPTWVIVLEEDEPLPQGLVN